MRPLRSLLALALVFGHVFADERPDLESGVLNGIDVLERDGFGLLAGRRVGLITNHTGINRAGVATVQLLHESKAVDLAALFSPEHGFAGALDQSHITDARDVGTGLKIFSLYGQTRIPTTEALAGIDTLVFDIQDIGTRFYTYISTMGGAMRAAAQHKIDFVVLDRVNPIGGRLVGGPVLDPGSESFVGFHRLAVRHGMTTGELATMFRDELELDLQLTVIRVQGWAREMVFDQTQLLWVNPSPNMRSLTQAFLYPGVGLLETTNLSVGRGTDTPFEVIGAPWINARELAHRLNASGLAGVRFVPIRFTPDASKFEGQRCDGVNVIVTERDLMDPLAVGLTIAVTLRRLYPDDWDTDSLNRLLSSNKTFAGILNGLTPSELTAGYQDELDAFKLRRAKYLLYPEPR